MDTTTAHTLNALNRAFYVANADSFSQTRSHGWPGWERLVANVGIPATVLDIACGNLRFQKYLNEVGRGKAPVFYNVDICDDLVGPDVENYQHLDIADAAIRGCSIAPMVDAPECDLAVSFGFMHHVPGLESRLRIAEMLAEKTASGGHLCISFWRFMDDEKLAKKALGTTEAALAKLDVNLEVGDYLLDWQGSAETLRYCHSFSDDEIDSIVDSLASYCHLEQRYEADGKSGALNTYLMMRRR